MAHVDSKASPDLQVERPDSENLEKGEGKVVDSTDEDEEFSYEEQRKIIHRIDRRLVVILGYVLRLFIPQEFLDFMLTGALQVDVLRLAHR